MSRRGRRWFAVFGVAVGSWLLIGLCYQLRVPFLFDLEERFFDLRQSFLAPETKVSDEIVMVWLDEATMRQLPYRSPVPRDFLRGLNEKILVAGPKVVGYDIFFKDPTIAEIDQSLAESFAKGPVYAVAPLRQATAWQAQGERSTVDHPLEIFEKSLRGIGLADLPFNAFDATVRKFQTSFETEEGIVPTFAALLAKVSDTSATGVRLSSGGSVGSPEVSDSFVAEDSPTPLQHIRFASPPHKIGAKENVFKIFPAHLVARGLAPAAWLKDKIILIGAAYDDGQDAYLTPYYNRAYGYPRMNGVEIHAHILNQLLTNQFYHEPPQVFWILRHAGPVLVATVAALFLPLGFGVAIFMLLLVGLVTSGFLVFHYLAWVAPIVLPGVGVILSYGAGLGWRALTEGKEKRFIKGVFARYVPPVVVEKMTHHPELLTLGGEERTVTCFFTDIAGFTTISERMTPQELVTFLNDYLDVMSGILFSHGGTLDKYEGDAMIAFFNAPLDLPNHAQKAVEAALAIVAAGKDFSEKWREKCRREIITRIGINTGRAVVGNMGSNVRFDYTAIGDTVNLAARLEGANKFYDTRILIGEATYEMIKDAVLCKPVDWVKVKGKTRPVGVYAPIGPQGTVETTLLAQWQKEFEQKLNAGKFTELTSK